jgi:hypothetical protein
MSQNISILSKNDITQEEKNIYNTFLVASKKSKNKPFKLRQDFSKLDDEIYIALKKLGSFFKNNKNISLNDYFWAPYEVYSKDEYFDLSFYNTRKAIIAYTQYLRQKETQDADSEGCINDCKAGLKNIYTFCAEQNLTLNEYKELNNTSIPIFLVHLKEHKINFYILHGLSIEQHIKRIEPELLDFYCKDFYDIYYKTRTKYTTSTKLKHTIKKALEIIQTKLLILTKPNPL